MTLKKLTASTDYLLPQSLDGLHVQSQEWLDTVALWKDETRFFGNLLKSRREGASDRTNYTGLLQNLDKLHELLYDYLEEEIQAHERLLSRIQKGETGLADSDYRDQHRKLAEKVRVFGADFREFKRMVFGYARKW